MDHVAIMKKTKIEGIIFDLGGVLVEDFGRQFLDNASRKLKVPATKLKKVIQQEEAALQKGKETSLEFWRRVCGQLKIECPLDKVLETLWTRPYRKHARIKKDMLKLVKKLREQYKVVVLSNTIKEHSKINGERGIFDYFDAVLLSNEIGLRKPEKKFFQEASKKLSISPDRLLFVDDEMRWVKAARKHGLRAILFKSKESLEETVSKLRR